MDQKKVGGFTVGVGVGGLYKIGWNEKGVAKQKKLKGGSMVGKGWLS